jgi:hypothetical protein
VIYVIGKVLEQKKTIKLIECDVTMFLCELDFIFNQKKDEKNDNHEQKLNKS